MLVVDPISECGTPTISVPDAFDITPGEPDSIAIDIDDDGILEAVAIGQVLVKDDLTGIEGPLNSPDNEIGTVPFKVSFPVCSVGPTSSDYIVIADACHSGDLDPKGFFTDAFGVNCPAPQLADGGNDQNQPNDAPIARTIDDFRS